MEHVQISSGSSAFYPPATQANHPDQLSREGVSTFFDLYTHDDFAPENIDTLMSNSTGLTQDWNLPSSHGQIYRNGSAHDIREMTMCSNTGNMDDEDLAWSLEEYRIIGQVAQEHSPVPMSWIEPGLSPYADDQLSTQPIWQVTSDLKPDQDFIRDSGLENVGELSLSLNRQCHNGGIIDTGTAANSVPTTEPSTVDIKPLIAPPGESLPRLNLATSTKSKRTRISNAAKKILNEHFGVNPYPTETETSTLESKTRLTGKTIQTWFSNTRSRKKITGETSATGLEGWISRTSLEALEKISPAASMDSVHRYLAQPASEDPVHVHPDTIMTGNSTAAIAIESTGGGQIPVGELSNHPLVSRRGSSTRAGSVAGSDSSRGSAKSHTSQKSFRSVDSRGSRRGRKLWKRSQTSLSGDQHAETSVGVADTSNGSMSNVKRGAPPYYCTWATCVARFHFRSAWTRHEEAVHYQPWQWICCLKDTFEQPFGQCFICGQGDATCGHIATEHFASCINKDQAERTFYRRDQLIQHIKGTHSFPTSNLPGEYVFTDLARHWEVASPPSSDTGRLTCGICGTFCQTWQARQDHVFKHLQSGICKQSWWPERKRIPRIGRIGTNMFPARCGNCGTRCESAIDACENHSNCVAWSCRYLHDWHAIYTTWTIQSTDQVAFACQLCTFMKTSPCNFSKLTADDDYRPILKEHAQSHNLRSCAQHRFADLHSFVTHLEDEHNAVFTWSLVTTVQPWKCTQKIRSTPGGLVMITTQKFQKSALCVSKDVPFHDDEHGLAKKHQW